MQEFYQWLIFESFIALICLVVYLYAAGIINTPRTKTESFIEWRKTRGTVVQWMCILVILVCVSVMIYKYYQVKETLNAPPGLETE